MRSGNHPQQPLSSCIVNRDPSAAQAAIASGDVKFVLMPSLPCLPAGFAKNMIACISTAVPVPFSDAPPQFALEPTRAFRAG